MSLQEQGIVIIIIHLMKQPAHLQNEYLKARTAPSAFWIVWAFPVPG